MRKTRRRTEFDTARALAASGVGVQACSLLALTKPMTLALSLFGAPTVTFGATSTALEFERRTQLVAYLALKRTWVSRSELAALLWPDQDTKLAQTNLRKALFRLHSLPWGDQIEAQAGALRFEPSNRCAVVRDGAARATPR